MTSPTAEFTIRRDEPQTMRDGTVLRADVYLPKGKGPFPALLERTPYSKDNSPECQVGSPQFFASQGYAVVIQDVRGRFASEGRFIPFHDDGWGENRDGYDTVEWIAAQPWCDGNVGTIGGSYAGATQYRLAPTRPPHLRAMYVRESSADYWAEWVYHGGAFELGFMVEWTFKWTYNNLQRLARSPEEYARRKGILEKALGELPSWHRDLPLHPNPLGEGLDDWYNEFLAHPDDGPYWWRWNIGHRHGDIETPIVHMGGWFDIFLAGTIKNFVGTRAKARTPAARDAQYLVVGPWIHGPWNMAKTVQGEIDFGPEAIRDYNAIRVPWFDHWLRGAKNSVPDEPRVQLFVMGENRWRTADTYPWPGVRETAWHLRDGGRLTPEAPTGAEQADGYRYDPEDPVPTLGGATLNIPGGCLRPAADRGPVPHLHQRAPRARSHGDRRRPVRAPRDVDGARHRFRRATDRRPSRRDVAPPLRRHPAGALPRVREPAGPAHARPGLRAHGRPLGDRQHVPPGAPGPRRGHVVELPALRPQPEHRRGHRHRGARAGRAQHRLPRRSAAIPHRPARGRLSARREGAPRGRRRRDAERAQAGVDVERVTRRAATQRRTVVDRSGIAPSMPRATFVRAVP